MNAEILTVSSVAKRYGGVDAVDDASIEVSSGAVHGLIGPNGAGKSTLLSLITGATPADHGSIRWAGHDLVGLSPLQVARLGIARTFQGATPFPGMSVLDNVLVGLHLQGQAGVWSALARSSHFRAEEQRLRGLARSALDEVGLSVDLGTIAADLPFGQLRLLEVARALGTSPRLLLLDEPAAGLNRQETEGLGHVIGRLRGRGIGVIVVDHDMPFVFGICDRITVMQLGRVIASGAPAEIAVDPVVLSAYLSDSEAA